jgi:murein DD-endopeptidase MepM/ murein hydrolase activator NlpD
MPRHVSVNSGSRRASSGASEPRFWRPSFSARPSPSSGSGRSTRAARSRPSWPRTPTCAPGRPHELPARVAREAAGRVRGPHPPPLDRGRPLRRPRPGHRRRRRPERRSDRPLRVRDTGLSEAGRRGALLSSRLQLVEKRLSTQADQLALTPTIAPAAGVLTAGFGQRPDPFTGHPEYHPGIDISTPAGNRVVAPARAPS